MKKLIFLKARLLLFVVACGLFLQACNKDRKEVKPLTSNSTSKKLTPSASNVLERSRSIISGCGGIFHDASGQVTIQIFCNDFGPASHPNSNERAVNVGPDYVCVGGGGLADYKVHGAYLTESRPTGDFRGWVVTSKDHIREDRHKLHAYAIGLKLRGVTADQLRQHLKIFPGQESYLEAAPRSEAIITDNSYALIGGGVQIRDDHKGSLLVASYPEGSSWVVKSKDHVISDPARIKAYAIGIKRYIPGFGSLETDIESAEDQSVKYSPKEVTFTLPSDGYVLSSVGAYAEYNGKGRLLYMMRPLSGTQVEVGSKDHIRPDNGRLHAYAVRIKKR
ncbi:hypothetical protein BKI52_39845 [marine bacterium AO1-C]|nr:hypothetical protein BKI52_39845 [marine bacterium AO1-C]